MVRPLLSTASWARITATRLNCSAVRSTPFRVLACCGMLKAMADISLSRRSSVTVVVLTPKSRS
ncbi:hypothetical protein D3C85_1908450 [compost metagenome]